MGDVLAGIGRGLRHGSISASLQPNPQAVSALSGCDPRAAMSHALFFDKLFGLIGFDR